MKQVLLVQEHGHNGLVKNPNNVKSCLKHAGEEWESKYKMRKTQECNFESKVKTMASKLEDKVNNGKPGRKKYQQGARIAK